MSFLTESQLDYYRKTSSFQKRARSNLKSFGLLADLSIFLSHSHKDKQLVEGFVNYLASLGISVYVDWKDTSMPPITNGATADKIKERIRKDDLFMMLATENACNSKWVPWEVGVADEIKGRDGVVVIPVKDPNGRFHGNEYLQLYQRLEVVDWVNDKLEIRQPQRESGGILTEDFLKGYTK